jgi:uncharacterized protein with HEPN domain
MKPGRTLQIYFDDILDSILRIENYIEGIKKDEFEHNEEKQDAVIRRLEIIGEAIKHIPDNIREKHPDIPWKQIAGLRDVVIHEYFGVSISRIWKVLVNDLGKLKETIIIMKSDTY